MYSNIFITLIQTIYKAHIEHQGECVSKPEVKRENRDVVNMNNIFEGISDRPEHVITFAIRCVAPTSINDR